MTYSIANLKQSSSSTTGGTKIGTVGVNAYGWRDLTGAITIHDPAGPSAEPAFNVYRGGIRAWQFTVGDEIFIEFHMPHDYVPGSDIHIHVHWSHIYADVTSGGTTWDFECSYAPGHDQGPFTAPVTAQVVQAASTTQYQHMIAEVQLSAASPSAAQLDSDVLEVDGLILVRIELTANNMSAAHEPFLHMVDIHYQSTNLPTKNKAPNFYT